MTPWLEPACRLAVFVGPGGVGKTTLSAACGVAAARAGRRVLVLTADPARRLAGALGLSCDMVDPVPVAIPHAAGSLHACMVVSRRVYDGLLARLLPASAAAALQAKNRMYDAFSRTLARSHAYAAIERLHRSTHDGDFDLVVLDTPPAEATIQILEAPRRLRAFLDGALLRVFGAGRPVGRRLDRIAASGAVRRLGSRILGGPLLAETRAFFDVVGRLREAFVSRTEQVAALLRSDAARFVLVATPGPTALATTIALARDLRRQGLDPRTLLVNRAYAVLDPEHPRRVETSAPPLSAGDLPPDLADAAVALRTLRRAAATQNRAALDRIRACVAALADVSETTPPATFLVPRMDGASHDVEGLAPLADALTAPVPLR